MLEGCTVPAALGQRQGSQKSEETGATCVTTGAEDGASEDCRGILVLDLSSEWRKSE